MSSVYRDARAIRFAGFRTNDGKSGTRQLPQHTLRQEKSLVLQAAAPPLTIVYS